MKKSILSLLAALFLSSCSFRVRRISVEIPKNDSTSSSLPASSIESSNPDNTSSSILELQMDDFIYSITEDGEIIITGLVDQSRKEVHIPSCFTGICDFAFIGCIALTSITIPDSVTIIGNYAFCDCTSLTSITIPDSVSDIGGYAFSGCKSLTSITIPDSVTFIGEYAFLDCKQLSTISFNGTIAQWNSITKGSNWNKNVPATTVSCTDYAVPLN